MAEPERTFVTGLRRFLDAQRDMYDTALGELRDGRKRSHWMWFIFPQISGLGRSGTARFFAISGLQETRDYLAHPVLGRRLDESTLAVLGWNGRRDAEQIFGPVDALKFASSMTLFEAAGGNDHFGQALDAFHAGRRDERTLAFLLSDR